MEGKNMIVLTSRVHPGESLASYKLKGFMEYLTGDTAEAGFLLDNFVFIIVPMLNPDGVCIGNYRTSLSGNDLNRVWEKTDRFTHPEIYYTKKLMHQIKRKNTIYLYCDFHGHSIK